MCLFVPRENSMIKRPNQKSEVNRPPLDFSLMQKMQQQNEEKISTKTAKMAKMEKRISSDGQKNKRTKEQDSGSENNTSLILRTQITVHTCLIFVIIQTDLGTVWIISYFYLSSDWSTRPTLEVLLVTDCH